MKNYWILMTNPLRKYKRIRDWIQIIRRKVSTYENFKKQLIKDIKIAILCQKEIIDNEGEPIEEISLFYILF